MSDHEEGAGQDKPRHVAMSAHGSIRLEGRATWHVWPRLPLDAATEPHPSGVRIARGRTSQDGITFVDGFVLYPSAPRTQDEADAEGARVRAAAEAAAAAVLDAAIAEAGAPPSPVPEEVRALVKAAAPGADTDAKVAMVADAAYVAAAASRVAAAAAEAAAEALRAELAPPPLTDEEEACVSAVRGYLQGFLDAAALYDTGAKKPAKARPQGPAAVGTYPELAVLGFAAADARTGAHWTEAPGGGALVHNRKKAGLQVRFVPSAGGERWADPAPGALSVDLFATLTANGGLDTVFLAQVGADLALESEHEDVSLDDLGRLIGRDPRSTREREAMRRDLWERLKFLDGLTVWGVRKGTYRDPSTRQKVPIESRDELFRIGGTMWPEQGTLDGSDVPLVVSFAAGPLLARFRGHPEVLTSFGEYRRLAAIPGEKPSGAWARSMGLTLTQRWRELASYGRTQKLTRRYLLTTIPPAPTVDEVLAGPHPARARRYFTQALALLKTAGVVAAYAEPNPATLPRYGWADAWLRQTVETTPPAVVLEAGDGMQATREEAEEKATRGRKRRPKKTGPAPE